MNIDYSLWPIWADYLEEQGQNTELLRYVLTWGITFTDGYYIENKRWGKGVNYEYGNGYYYVYDSNDFYYGNFYLMGNYGYFGIKTYYIKYGFEI